MHRRPFPIVGVALCVMIAAASVLMWTVTKVTAIPPEQLTVPVVPAAKAASTAASPAAAAPPTASSGSSSAASASSSSASSPSAKAPTTADSVTLTSFADDPSAPTPTADVSVHVTTVDDAPVTLVLYYAGGNTPGQAGSNAGLQDEFTLSGRTSYDVADRVTALQFCYTRYFGVTADLASPESGASPATDFRQLQAPSCS